jgi:hypothetical protein
VSIVKNPLFTSLLCGLLAVSTSASAAVLTFEDLDPSPAAYASMSPYNGFSFVNWFYGPNAAYMPASGVVDLFTDYADPEDPTAYLITNNNAIERAAGFYFDGAWISGYSGVTFELWLAGSYLGAFGSLPDGQGPDPYGPTFLASGYAGLVDKVVVSGVQGYYSMDDFTYRLAESSGTLPVPGGAGLVLLALSLAAVNTRRQASDRKPA